jgi:hypothetical protein
MAKKTKANWIADATKNKGALHRALGVPEGKTIPKANLDAAAKRSGKVAKEANLAKTLSNLSKKKKKAS